MDPQTHHTFRRVCEVLFYAALGALWAWVVKILTHLDNGVGFWILTVTCLILLIILLITREDTSGSSS